MNGENLPLRHFGVTPSGFARDGVELPAVQKSSAVEQRRLSIVDEALQSRQSRSMKSMNPVEDRQTTWSENGK